MTSILISQYVYIGIYNISFIAQHPMKLRSNGLPVIMAPIVLYSDDTSGNRSKKWNKFDCWCMSMAGLPISEARKIKNILFICCSNKLTALQMADGLVDDLLLLEEGIEACL